MTRLGSDRLGERARRGVVAVLGGVVSRLLKLRLTPAPGPRLVVYGDLKPEHVLFPDGPDEQPVFIDPGLSRGGDHQDARNSPPARSSLRSQRHRPTASS
ncbi:hypothetical protein ACWCQZ_50885 [Streptomyces sp. NPDC002285]